ncbi:MAG: hypothetical protein PVF49_08455 [Anaerolineales bacterium]
MPSWFIEWTRRAGLNHLAASMLDGFGPAAIVLAQLAYFADPFISSPSVSMTDLGGILEDSRARADLITELDKDIS